MKKNIKLLNRRDINEVLKILKQTYPDTKCGLNFGSPYELTIALILAAQCTDKRVNIIRPKLTNKYPNFYELSKASYNDVYEVVKSCSFPNNKSKHIVEAAKYISKNYSGKVPSTMNELIKIPGIGRKSANLILVNCFDNAVGIAVDTHVKRLSKRIGLSKETKTLNIEKELMKKFPKKDYKYINHLFVDHGKNICTARKPKCEICPLNNICKKNI